MWEAVWGGFQPQPWRNDIILAPRVSQNPKNWAKKCGYNSLRLLPYAHGQRINVLKCFVHVLCGFRKQFEVTVSLNHGVLTSCWLHTLSRTTTSDSSSVGITVWGCCCMSMDSISMGSHTLYMSNMDGEAVWGGCQSQPWRNDIILTPQVTQNPKIWAKKCGYNTLRLLPYAHGQHINVLKHIVYVLCRCGK